MSRHSMAIYGERARLLDDPLLASARYPEQSEGERRAILDIARKLDLQATDTLLDIGCGIGNLTVPLSYMVKQTVAIDSEFCVARLLRREPANTLSVSGNFLDLDGLDSVDAVLCYAVLHYLTDAEEVMRFVRKAIRLLRPHGRALFGDLPNTDRKARFLASSEGQLFDAAWKRTRHDSGESALTLPPDEQLPVFDDALCLRLVAECRSAGFDAWLLDQPPDLPFGHTREDLLVIRP